MLRPSGPSTLLIRLRRAWRRSLQLRVVTITLVSSTLMVGTFSVIVGNMITNGLVESRHQKAYNEVTLGTEQAREDLRTIHNADDPNIATAVLEVAAALSRGGEDTINVAIMPGSPNIHFPGQSHPLPLVSDKVPAELRRAVATDRYVSQRLMLDLDGNGPQLYLVFGRSLTITPGTLEIYYFFPLAQEVGLSELNRNTLAATGLSLVLVLGLLAFFVTRIVVRPVRVAARTAQRLSAGLLDQRMEVHGEDDLAALAASFNQMAENLQRHIQRLEEMSRLQRRFTSDVSHELRTPLTTVRMAADLIFSERDGFDPPVARSAELLQAELDRFEGLLTDLLEISRFDAGFAMLDAEPSDLVPIVRQVVDRLSVVAERAGVQLDLHVPAEPVIAEVDLRRLERILRNLIGNAVEHGEGRPVEVRLAADEGAVAVTIRDHGVGLKPGEEKLVFNRFWRADPSRARQTGGTGLGLSISIEDARLHGGWLEAWGAPGQGAQFRLTLPCCAGDRLIASPLRLVPSDAVFRGDHMLQTDLVPEATRPREPKPAVAAERAGPAPAVERTLAAAEPNLAAEPAQVPAEPAQVRAEPAQVRAEPAQVRAEPAHVPAEPAEPAAPDKQALLAAQATGDAKPVRAKQPTAPIRKAPARSAPVRRKAAVGNVPPPTVDGSGLATVDTTTGEGDRHGA